jgi:hypothetical protein
MQLHLRLIQGIALSFLLGLVGCAKPNEPTPITGCTDPNSALYNPEADTDDGTCTLVYATAFELVNHEAIEWDFLINVEADVQLLLRKNASTTNLFTSFSVNNLPPTTSQTWSAPVSFQLTNEMWYWELYDLDEPIEPNDLMASGYFNPFMEGVDGVVAIHSADSLTHIKITFETQ